MPNPPRTLLCLGDSNTWAGHWVDHVDAALAVRFPDRTVDVINAGLPSETLSGLSEVGHAGGAFPRPVLFERLERVLDAHRPDTVAACYGMNDGIYQPLDDRRFASFRQGVERLERMVAARGARLFWITPPPFDRSRFDARAAFDYDFVLAAYSRWLLGRRGSLVADARGPLLRHLAARRQSHPDYALASDGVHIHSYAHGFIARALLSTMGFGPKRPPAAATGEGAIRMPPPMPMDPAWESAELAVDDWPRKWGSVPLSYANAGNGRYRLRENGTLLATVDGARLRGGVDLAMLNAWSGHKRASAVHRMVVERQRLLRDAWLFRTGHERPGMPAGKPIRTALREASEWTDRIAAEVAGPVLEIERA